MARPLRIDYPGLAYHVFNRGVKKLPIFQHPDEYREFIDRLIITRSRYGIEIEQYSLMTNHFHLLIRLLEGSLSAAMQYFLSRYARWFNSNNELAGHAFQGRFGSIPVQEDSYYTTVCRYIHLNPVKAGLVALPEDYVWSNYKNLIEGKKDLLASGGNILEYFGRDESTQRARYRQFVEDGIRKPETVTEKTLRKMRAWGSMPNYIPAKDNEILI